MNDLITNGIDHSVFDLEWAKRGGVVMLKKYMAKVTYVCNISGSMHVAQILGQKVFNGESFANVSPKLLRMATPDECRKAGSEYLEPPMIWRDIESAPKNTWVIATDGFYVTEAFFSTQRNEWIMKNGDELSEPTHWMPLPQPPKDE